VTSGAPASAELVSFADISTDVLVRVAALPRPDAKQSATLIGEYPGGMGANVAAAFARLGGRAALVSCVGGDERGRRNLADLSAADVDVSRVVTVGGETFWTIALIDDDGEKSLVEFSGEASGPPWGRIDWAVLDGAAVAYTVGAEGGHACELFDQCRARGVTTALDLESADLDDDAMIGALLARTDVLFAPLSYALTAGGTGDESAAVRGLQARGPRLVAVTMGGRGCLVGREGDALVEVPGQEVEVVDTTGAGDCFAGAFLYGLVRGWAPAECGTLATLMAAHSVTAYGSRGRLLGRSELAALPAAAALPLAAT